MSEQIAHEVRVSWSNFISGPPIVPDFVRTSFPSRHETKALFPEAVTAGSVAWVPVEVRTSSAEPKDSPLSLLAIDLMSALGKIFEKDKIEL